MGSRSPEEVAQWKAALLRARDRAAEQRGDAAPAVAASSARSSASPPAAAAPENGVGASVPASPRESETAPGIGAPLAASKSAKPGRSTIGHLPPDLRDVQEIARRGPLPRVSAVISGSSALLHNDGTRNDVYGAANEGAWVLPMGETQTWRLSALENGLRFFESATGSSGSGWGASPPCTKVNGRVRAPSDVIFKLVMDHSRSRAEWDCTFSSGTVVEQIDGHTEVVHCVLRPMRLASPALPSRPRDMVLRRYWCREEDGTYAVYLKSVEHALCPPRPGIVRAELLGGSFLITPLPRAGGGSGDSLFQFMLELAPNGWMLPCTGLPHAFQRAILANTAAGIRDFFEQVDEHNAANFETGLGDPLADLLNGSDNEDEDEEEAALGSAHESSGLQLAANAVSDAAAIDAPDGDATAACEPKPLATPPPVAVSCASPPTRRPTAPQAVSPMASAAPLLSEPPVSFPKLPPSGGGSCPFGAWPPSKGQKGINCWCRPPINRFVVRSATYLQNGVKCPAGTALMSLIAVDWLVSEERIDFICGRPNGAMRRHILPAVDPDTHVFCVNLQVPGSKPYSIIFYFAHKGAPERDSVLGRFWHGDDAYRAPRFKLIPAITEGAWVVQRSVGTKPLIVGNALKTTYHGGGDSLFLEVDVDIGSSSVANSVTRFVMSALRTLVIDLAFLIEAKTEAELPEKVLGTIRVSHLDPDLAAVAPPAA